MKASEVKSFVQSVLSSGTHIPLMVWGPPGVGKSSIMAQIAQEKNMGFIDLRLSQLNPVDLRGLPYVNKEKHKAEWLEPDFLPNGHSKERGILFLDEINLAPNSVQAAAYQLVLDRRLGDYRLPEGWHIVAAGNRAEDQANVTKFPAPLANRFVHIELEADLDEWRKWAVRTGVNEKIIAFLSKMPQYLFVMPRAGEKSFPTPRSWGNASQLLATGLRIDAAVGEGVAATFVGFCKVYDRFPDIDAILAGKETYVPKEPDVLWALVIALAVRSQVKDIPALFGYIANMPKEFEVITILNFEEKLRGVSEEASLQLTSSTEWERWITQNQDIIESGRD